jgi:hypothetical protein
MMRLATGRIEPSTPAGYRHCLLATAQQLHSNKSDPETNVREADRGSNYT